MSKKIIEPIILSDISKKGIVPDIKAEWKFLPGSENIKFFNLNENYPIYFNKELELIDNAHKEYLTVPVCIDNLDDDERKSLDFIKKSIIDFVMENQNEFFDNDDDDDITREDISNKFNNFIIQTGNNKEFFRIKLEKSKKDKIEFISTKVFLNGDKNQKIEHDKIIDYFKKDSKIKFVALLTGVYYNIEKDNIGFSWKMKQVYLYPKENDDSDDDDEIDDDIDFDMDMDKVKLDDIEKAMNSDEEEKPKKKEKKSEKKSNKKK